MIQFLTQGEVFRAHETQIARFGGSTGIRDIGLLESALSMPRVSFGGTYLHGDIYQMAAAYLFHIVSNHPFIDGNKRTGTAIESPDHERETIVSRCPERLVWRKRET